MNAFTSASSYFDFNFFYLAFNIAMLETFHKQLYFLLLRLTVYFTGIPGS